MRSRRREAQKHQARSKDRYCAYLRHEFHDGARPGSGPERHRPSELKSTKLLRSAWPVARFLCSPLREIASRSFWDLPVYLPILSLVAEAAAHVHPSGQPCVIKQAEARTSLALSLPPHAWRLAPPVPPPPPRLQSQLQLPPAPAHTSCTDTAAQNRATPRRTSSSSCLRRFLPASSRSLACLRRHGAAVLKRAARMAQGRYLQCFATI